jgi:signal transduction histidine kinase
MDSSETDSPTAPTPNTYFAPAGRDAPAELERKRHLVEHAELLRATLDAMPTFVVVLNDCRQIVGTNAALLRALKAELDEVIGRRPGEVFECVHVKGGPDGCGTSEGCAFCGAVKTVLASRRTNQQATGEARILCDRPDGNEAMDVRITATPVRVEGEDFTVAALEDISHQKRLAVLTRIFFHDVMNTIAAMKNYVRLAGRKLPKNGDDPGPVERLEELTDMLVDEILAQRDLTLAESGELEIHPQSVRAAGLLRQLCDAYAAQELAAGRKIELADPWDGSLTTDVRLLVRVLGNMLRNALEATDPGGVVTVRCASRAGRVVFEVHNDAVMPKDVQMQVFQRSFSTKAAIGRGIGTHSMKLLGERYLHGTVGFTSQAPEGTTFWIELAEKWPEG